MRKVAEFSGKFAEYAANAESMDSLDAVELCMAIEEAVWAKEIGPEDVEALGHVRKTHAENWEKMLEDMHEDAKAELTRLGLWGKPE